MLRTNSWVNWPRGGKALLLELLHGIQVTPGAQGRGATDLPMLRSHMEGLGGVTGAPLTSNSTPSNVTAGCFLYVLRFQLFYTL